MFSFRYKAKNSRPERFQGNKTQPHTIYNYQGMIYECPKKNHPHR
jgi:hypothetical protein